MQHWSFHPHIDIRGSLLGISMVIFNFPFFCLHWERHHCLHLCHMLVHHHYTLFVLTHFFRMMCPKQHWIPISKIHGLGGQGPKMFSTMMDSSLLITSSGEVFSLLLAVLQQPNRINLSFVLNGKKTYLNRLYQDNPRFCPWHWVMWPDVLRRKKSSICFKHRCLSSP